MDRCAKETAMNALLTHPLVAALATTLLHSLWMFCVLIGVCWWSAGALEQARHRYVAFMITLLSLPLVFTVVLLMEWRVQATAWSGAALLGESLRPEAVLELTTGLSKLGISTAPHWLGYLAVTYLAGLVISLVISSYSYAITFSMRRGGWFAPPALRQLFDRLRQELVPGRKVEWKITKRVTGAMAVGILRPVILFPVGLVNALSAQEVEAILRHELTHLLRYDPVWNAVQELLVNIFFYHPLVYLLARRLDREREYACDDAVSATTDRSLYAKALLQAAKYSLNPSKPFTMAATNNRHFSHRIKRLFGATADVQSFSTNNHRSYLLAPLAILPLFLLFAFAPNNSDQQAWLDARGWVISGTVTDCDTGDPLIGTSINLVGTNTGAITDFDGNYELRVPPGQHTLSYAYVGYQTMELSATI
jgi:beta-lactamase regulating signal transducer with metallopeptidase domain